MKSSTRVLLALVLGAIMLTAAEVRSETWWVVCSQRIQWHDTQEERIFFCNQCIGPVRMPTVPDRCAHFGSEDDAIAFARKHCDCPKRSSPPRPAKKTKGRYE